MPKNVQIPYELFYQLIQYHLLQPEDDTLRQTLQQSICKALETKLDAMINHDLYSRSKDANLSPQEREKARKQYLDRAGIPESFRWGPGKSPYKQSD